MATTVKPDLIVVDFACDAADVIRNLKANPTTCDIPVIALAEMLEQ